MNVSQLNRSDTFDRYALLEYRTRFAGDKAGVTAHVYAQEFVRGFTPLQVLTPSPLLPGGLSFDSDILSYRSGGAVDGDFELGSQIRVLYGGEAFHEWKPSVEISTLPGAVRLHAAAAVVPARIRSDDDGARPGAELSDHVRVPR